MKIEYIKNPPGRLSVRKMTPGGKESDGICLDRVDNGDLILGITEHAVCSRITLTREETRTIGELLLRIADGDLIV